MSPRQRSPLSRQQVSSRPDQNPFCWWGSMASSFSGLHDLFRPTWRRALLAVAVAAVAFLMPQEAPLVFYPLNDPSRGLLQLQITCGSSVTGTTKFYLDTGKGFSEDETISWPIAPSSQPYTYTFPLPDAPLLGLRLDPFGSGPGEFTITNLRIIERQGKEIRRFTPDDLRQLNQIKDVVTVPGGWKLVAGGDNPHVSLDLPAPIVPDGMNTRNLQRCLLSWSYLGLMLWILLLAVYFALVRGGPLKEITATMIFLAGIALLFSFVGNRRLIRDSLHYANFRPPAGPVLWIEFEVAVDHPSPAQLFWDTGPGFNETESVLRDYSPLAGFHPLRFPLPGVPIRGLRFDPLIAEGSLEIRQIQIVDANRRTCHVVPLSSLRAAQQIAAMEIKKDQLVIHTTPGGNDPITIFDPAEVKTIAGLIGTGAEQR
jgi:hypothetical protein